MTARRALAGARIFDGSGFLNGHALILHGSEIEAIVPESEVAGGREIVALEGGLLAPGFVDLQVNGGDGVMLGDDPAPETLRRIAMAHARLGATTILPTLITDTPETTAAAIAATVDAIAADVPGIAGLHLEGPHLSLARKGAHDPALIRPMQAADLDSLVAAAGRLPLLKVTVAPESVTPDQIRTMAGAGILVSLGHSGCSFNDAQDAVDAGARIVTHLFNAMSQLTARAPGLVGAALNLPHLSAGLIADLVHVHPATIRTALQAKPDGLFLVSDAMACAGTDIKRFDLRGRTILRREGRLTLSDGTLAGADLDLATAVRNLAGIGVDDQRALAMATSVPARAAGVAARAGRIAPGYRADIVHLSDAYELRAVWQGGRRVPG